MPQKMPQMPRSPRKYRPPADSVATRSADSIGSEAHSRKRTADTDPESNAGWPGALEKVFAIDVRSLALLRVCLGLLLITDLIARGMNLEAHYTDTGVMPIAYLSSTTLAQYYYLTIHTMHGSYGVQCALFLIAAVFALALIAGYRTRFVTIVCWVLLSSLQSRNAMIMTGADQILRMMIFWGMFLPLGACWSVDSHRHPDPHQLPKRVFSVATIALLLQVCFIYWFTVALKSDPQWRSEGTAVYHALTLDQFATPFGRSLIAYPALLKFFTFATMALELFGPVLVFTPLFPGPVRSFMVLTFICFHLGLGVTLELGLFPLISGTAWIAFLPGWFWDHWFRRTARFALGARNPLSRPWVEDRLQRLPQRAFRTGLHPAAQVFAGLCLLYVFLWNVRSLDFNRYETYFSQKLNWIGEILRLDQYWNLFAPFPMSDHGWYVIPAKLGDGTEVDLFNDGAPVTWTKPALVSAAYKNDRWRKYLVNLWMQENSNQRVLYASYLVRKWNREHGGDKYVSHVTMNFMLQRDVVVTSMSGAGRGGGWLQKLFATPTFRTSDPEKIVLGEYNFTAGGVPSIPAVVAPPPVP